MSEPEAYMPLTADKVRLLRDAVALQQSFLESHRRASAEPEYVAVVEGRQRDLDFLNRDLAEVSWALRRVHYDALQAADGPEFEFCTKHHIRSCPHCEAVRS